MPQNLTPDSLLSAFLCSVNNVVFCVCLSIVDKFAEQIYSCFRAQRRDALKTNYSLPSALPQPSRNSLFLPFFNNLFIQRRIDEGPPNFILVGSLLL
jgi:hypothetical protein